MEQKKKKVEQKTAKIQITKDMTIGDIVSKHPEVIDLLLAHGFHCIGCHVAGFETLEQGAQSHGMDAKQLDTLILEMNKLLIK